LSYELLEYRSTPESFRAQSPRAPTEYGTVQLYSCTAVSDRAFRQVWPRVTSLPHLRLLMCSWVVTLSYKLFEYRSDLESSRAQSPRAPTEYGTVVPPSQRPCFRLVATGDVPPPPPVSACCVAGLQDTRVPLRSGVFPRPKSSGAHGVRYRCTAVNDRASALWPRVTFPPPSPLAV
jgi:hypothetical protein